MRFKIQLATFICVLLFFPLVLKGTAFAESFKVTGTVIDAKNNPVVNATITATDVKTQILTATTTSDKNGYYSFAVPKGTYDITTSPPAGSGLQTGTDSSIRITSNISLHNDLNSINNVALHNPQKNSSLEKELGWVLVIVFVVVIIVAVGVVLPRKKK